MHVVRFKIGAKNCGIILGTFELGIFTVKKDDTLKLSSFKDFHIYKMIRKLNVKYSGFVENEYVEIAVVEKQPRIYKSYGNAKTSR